MTELETVEAHPYIELIAREARKGVSVAPDARARLLAAVRAEPLPRAGFASGLTAPIRWLIERHTWTLSPLGGFAVAAGLMAIGVALGSRFDRPAVRPEASLTASTPVSSSDSRRMQTFVFIAPSASKVSLVGDFNQWTVGATVMHRADHSGVWTVEVPLEAGRAHKYSFVVQGDRGEPQWLTDPGAPLAPDDGFGHANSVVLVPSSL